MLTVNATKASGDLDGWVTLVNNSGTAFQNARLQLVAGELNRVLPQAWQMKAMAMARCARSGALPPPFQQEAFNEYHLYTLGRRTSDLRQREQADQPARRQRLPLQKVYEVDGQSYYYRSAHAARRADERSRAGLLQIQERGESQTGHAAARRDDARLSGRFAAATRFSPAKTTSATRRRTKTSACTSATPSTSSPSASRPTTRSSSATLYEMEYEITLRNHKTCPSPSK